VPFLASVVLLTTGWFIRIKVAESPDFEAMKQRGQEVKVPVLHVVRHHPGALLKVVGARLAEVAWFYTTTTFALSYGTMQLGLSKSLMLNAITCSAVVGLVTMPLTGVLGDRVGHRRVFAIGALGICLFGFVFFKLLGGGNAWQVYVAMIVAIGLIYALLYGSEGNLFSAQFPAAVRYSGISLSVQVSGAIGGGLAPMAATWLLSVGHGHPGLVPGYLGVLGLIAILSAWMMKEEDA
jgi:MFS family permease